MFVQYLSYVIRAREQIVAKCFQIRFASTLEFHFPDRSIWRNVANVDRALNRTNLRISNGSDNDSGEKKVFTIFRAKFNVTRRRERRTKLCLRNEIIVRAK